MSRSANLRGYKSFDFSTLRAISRREFTARYRETILGSAWTLINPILLLVIYGLVFSQVFAASWTKPDGSSLNYALAIFSGFVLFNAIADALNGSTYVIARHANLVKRTQFNLEILPLSFSISSLYTFLVSLGPLGAMYILFEGVPPWTALLIFPLIVPLFTLCLCLTYLLSALAVFFPDIKQINSILSTAILFTSPIFFDSERLGDGFAKFLSDTSPFAILISFSKRILFYGTWDGLGRVLVVQLVGVFGLVLSRKIYRFVSPGFADVL